MTATEAIPGGPPPWARRTANALLAVTAVSLPLSTTGMQAGIIGLGVLSAAALVGRWGVVRRTPLDGVLAIFYGVLALSTLASGAPGQAIGWPRLWVVLTYFTVFWWLEDSAHATRFVRLVVGVALLSAVYGVVQHFTGADWYRRLLGRRSAVRPRDTESTGYAVVGFFRNYLTYAHVMLFPLAWAGALVLRGAWLGMVTAPLVVLALAFSTSRGAWLAALGMAGTFALVSGGRRAAWMLVGLAAVASVAFAATPELRAQAAHMFTTGGDNAGRVAIYRANLDVIHDHPVLGLGFGRYQRASKPYYDAHPDADRRSHAHSNYLQIGAEAGLVGLAAFCLLYATILLRGWPAVVTGGWPALGAWVGVVGFLIGGLTQYSFGDNEVALIMWVATAVLMRCREG